MTEGRNEPSMDEILSSIKRIIADDDRMRPATKRAPKAAPVKDDEDSILELTEAAEDHVVPEVLLDDHKAQSLRHSFSALQTLAEPGAAPQIVRSGETSLEGLTRDLLRPMLKDWLDTNLPPIVEAMVEREITRITKKGVMRGGLFAAILLATAPTPSIAKTLYVETGRLVDVVQGKVLTGQCIGISDDKITGIAACGPTPAGAERVDWSSYTVLPGLIDLHTHLADAGQSADLALPIKTSPAATALIGAHNARLTLEAGFTTVRDVGTYRGLTDVALKNAINAGHVTGPRMVVAGAYITVPKGGGELNGVVPNEQLPADMRLGVSGTPDEAAAKTNYLIDNGADFIKMIATGAVLAIGTEPGEPELTEEQMRAVVETAKARDVFVTAHAHGAIGIKNAIRAGVRSIEHASLIDDEALAMAKAAGTWLVMDIYNGDYIDDVGTREKWPEEYLRKNRETTDVQRQGFAKAVKMGVKLAYGTDSGVYPHGKNAKQFAYMVRYGMTPMQAIQSATIRAAELLGKEGELGSIQPGRFADLVAVNGDPLADVRVLEDVSQVMKEGVLVK